ncbi:MAG TPA: PIG-L family deacetylase [Fimbriimonas sp.]|nr:PIG-L family deacetylase [Fimbriimonas sp.]
MKKSNPNPSTLEVLRVPGERFGEPEAPCFDTDPSLTWLFCMTHPDDEISICAWIHRLVQNGNKVYISWTHSNRVRENEGRAVAHLLGVPTDRLFFHAAIDGSACDEIHELLPRFRKMMDGIKPDRVVCGAFEQGHIDHDTTNWLVNHSFDGPVLEVPFYHTYLTKLQRINQFSDASQEQVLQLTPDEQRLKKTVARQYPSQNIWKVLCWYEAWQKVRLKPNALAQSERMRFQTHKNFFKPNHPSRLAAKVEKCPTWKRWTSALLAAQGRMMIENETEPKVLSAK